MDNLEGLGNRNASLLVGEPIEPAEDFRDVIFSQQFLCVFPWSKLGQREIVGRDRPTETPFFDLLGCEGKNGQQFNHYFDKYLDHC